MNQSIHFLKPLDGDCLTDKAGVLGQDGTLAVAVRVEAPAGRELTVCGMPARYAAGAYFATVPLTGYQNRLIAEDDLGNRTEITVYRLSRATNCYRLSLDDNIWCLQDIAANKDTYTSIFDNPYFALLREAHLRYGAKIHANLFFETPKDGGFTLREMPDKFRHEFTDNADWLHLSFHAKAELPDKPYIDTDYDRIAGDFADVKREILRFAGEDAYAEAETTVHWGECTPEGLKALHDHGVRALAGYLIWNEKRDCGVVSYHLDRAKTAHASEVGIWKDSATDMIFSKIDVVLNSGTLDSITAQLDAAWETYPQKGFWEFLMHEQYFYPDYRNYLPDFKERIFAALDWAKAHGLTPAFLSETHLES